MKLTSPKRISPHPIIKDKKRTTIHFEWNGQKMKGLYGETISSALIANNINIFGYHHKDKSPQGIFCANGQCSQCIVIANNAAVKSCMTKIEKNMKIKSLEDLPAPIHKIYNSSDISKFNPIKKNNVSVLIIGGGPAGLSAALELGKEEIDTIIIDDKYSLGGKLLLQTHKFFGSVKDSLAGTRGFKIAEELEEKIKKLDFIEIWLNSTVIGIFSDKIVGVIKNGIYEEIVCKKMLIATGAREKMISFPGNTLPGIYGAGAFQTMINRDLVKPSEKILIVGAGNVGLITAYHAIQSGIEVAAIIEIQEKIGGYKVHHDKITKMGVPLYKKHKILYVNGTNKVDSVVIAKVDGNNKVESNSLKKYYVDAILIATGLNPVDEFYYKAKKWGIDVYSAGDAKEIAEASAAMFSGKIEGQRIINSLKKTKKEIPLDWYKKIKILKSKPNNSERKRESINKENKNVKFLPILHCYQEIPCDPCSSVCPENVIKMSGNKITGIPYLAKSNSCKGCMACVYFCPGLAITVIDNRKSIEKPTITIPYEMDTEKIKKGSKIPIANSFGRFINNYEIKRIIKNKKFPGTALIQFEIENKFSRESLGVVFKKNNNYFSNFQENEKISNKAIACRCERVSTSKIRSIIRNGITDINQIKSMTRLGMGSCGSKNCHPLVWQIFKEEKIKLDEITDRTVRPLFVEVPIGLLASKKKENNAS